MSPDKFTVNGSDGVVTGEFSGEGETALATVELARPRITPIAGAGGVGFAGPG